jgi:muconolactone delta-isomerase
VARVSERDHPGVLPSGTWISALAGQGHLLRLWALSGERRALGLWRARDMAEMQAILTSLPLDAWMPG